MISKSKYISGLSCPKLLWCLFNKPEMIPQTEEHAQSRMKQGISIGKLATKIFPNGIEIPFENSVNHTKSALQKKVPLFEASFSAGNAFCKVDILLPAGDEWDIIEVKSSTSVKDDHIQDVAFQNYCLEKAGIRVRRSHVMVINNEYVRDGDIDLKQLFTMHDLTQEMLPLLANVESNLKSMINVIKGSMPSPVPGTECTSPLECPVCSSSFKDADIFDLYRLGAKAWPLINQGVRTVKDLPSTFKLNDKQKIQKEAILSGKPQVNAQKVKQFLDNLKYPLCFLDFETMNPVIPLYNGTRPYQQLPFQFSLHVQESPNGKHYHKEFLADPKVDPRKQFLIALQDACCNKGTILAFNMPFEKKVLSDLATWYPEESTWIETTIDRFDDLIIPFKEFYVYYPTQHGSNSIKDVLPALTGESYDGMAIGDGAAASRAFEALILGKLDDVVANKISNDLRTYCKKDTEGMVLILKKMQEFSRLSKKTNQVS